MKLFSTICSSLALVLCLCLCQLSAINGLAKNPPELNELRFEFHVGLAELEKNEPLQELNGKYRGYLEKQKAAYQQAGNLEGILAVDEELKSIEADPGKALSSFPELKRLQGIYREQRKKLENAQDQKKLALIQSSEKKVKTLSVRWTREGKLDEAKLALEESKNITAMAGNLSLVRANPESATGDVANEEKTVTEKVVGTWVKTDTGTEFEIRKDGTIVGLGARAQIFASGKWELEGRNLTLVYSHGKLRLNLTGDDLIEGRDPVSASWRLRRVATSNAGDPPAPPPDSGGSSLATATKEKPFVNSLGMQFVPVPISGGPTDGQTVLFSVWETRVEDYEMFIRKDRDREWPKPGFPQKDDHPAVNVSWNDATAFCEWLTEKERKKGTIDQSRPYRLPTDHEWNCAVGIVQEDGEKLTGVYPWEQGWPPPKGAGNYFGEENENFEPGYKRIPIEGFRDPFVRTSPVGSFEPNKYGLFDVSGNVWEWCEDWASSEQKARVLRGASWCDIVPSALFLSTHFSNAPDSHIDSRGFRCVLAK